MTRSWAEYRPEGGDGADQLDVRQQDRAELPARGQGDRGERDRDRDSADVRQPAQLAYQSGEYAGA